MNAVQRIVVFGPESTGKTTLARRLAEHLGEPWAEEFVREFWEIRGGVIVAEDLGTVALGQIANEDGAAAAAGRAFVCDTDLLTCVLWNEVLFPEKCPTWVREEAEVRVRKGGLFLFCDTDAAWTPDPQRCCPDEAGRAMCRRLWREALSNRGISCVELRGDRAEREAAAIRAVAEFLKT
jgi:NadR type nicotinamide-nucleotide adenylyltransferase